MDSVYRNMRQVTALLRSGKIDPVELYEQSVARMKQLEHLNAIITQMGDSARIQAEEARERFRKGKGVVTLFICWIIFLTTLEMSK